MTTLRLRGRIATAALAMCAAGTAFGGLVAGLGVPAAASNLAAPAPAMPSYEPEIGEGVSRGPSFLTTSQLPKGTRFGQWRASGVYTGTPRNPKFCLENVLPAAETRYRTYRGKKNVAAEEFVTVADSSAAAAALVDKVRAQVQRCYQTWLDTDIPQYSEGKRSAGFKRYGTESVEDGMTVIGVFTVPPKGFVKMAHLYAIGRDGNFVVLVHLGVPGTKANAPVQKFTTTGAKALRQAF